MTLVAWANSENHLDKDNLVYLDSSKKTDAAIKLLRESRCLFL